jgi:hypothetical protein
LDFLSYRSLGNIELGMVVHTHNLSYLEGDDWEDHRLEGQFRQKVSDDPNSTNKQAMVSLSLSMREVYVGGS